MPSLMENGSSKVFQSSLQRLKGYCTFRTSTPWKLYHAKERSVTGYCSSPGCNSAFHVPSLCASLCESNKSGCSGGLPSGQDNSKSKTKQPHTKSAYKFSCLGSAILPLNFYKVVHIAKVHIHD